LQHSIGFGGREREKSFKSARFLSAVYGLV
jgi:hypothetical protein